MAKFKSGSHLINTPTVGNDLSADGQALSILFGGVQVRWQRQHQGLLTLGSLDVSFDNSTPAAKPQAS
jgi:hypothetical protein